MRWMMAAMAMALAPAVRADGERSGAFDYYVLALTWTPSFCAGEGRGREVCDDADGAGFSLHGLWPQYDDGWPSYCPTIHRDPSRRETTAQAELFGSSGSAWHQWNKHGTCSGLTASDYFRLAGKAFERVRRPSVLRELERPVTLPATVVEDAFLDADAALTADGVTVTCRDGRIAEVRICLDRSLDPRACTGRTARDCAQSDALLPPVE